MKKLLAILAVLLFAQAAHAQRLVTHGATDQSVYVMIVDSSDNSPETGVVAATAGLDLEYVRNGAASVDLTESNLASAIAAHSDGGIFHVGHGLYRVDLPDAAFASGAKSVTVVGTATGMFVLPVTVQLTAVDMQDSTPSVDVTQFGGTAGLFSEGRPQVLPETGAEVIFVPHTGSDATSGTNLRTAIEGASGSSPRIVVIERAAYNIGATSLTLPSKCSLIGSDRRSSFIVGAVSSGPMIIPSSYTTIQGLTLQNADATGSVVGRASGGISSPGARIRDVRLINVGAGGTAIAMTSSSPCALSISDSILTPDTAGIILSSGGHSFEMENVSLFINGASATFGLDLSGSSIVRGDRVYFSLPNSASGIAIKVADTAQATLHDSNLHALSADVNIQDLTAFVRLINSEFDRSAITGQLANLTDVFSPLRPTVPSRTLDVNVQGTAGLDWANIDNPSTAQSLSQTVIKDATDVDGATTIPVNQVPVAASRTWTLTETDDGLKDETERTLRDGDTRVFAIDFKNALPTNGRLEDVTAVSIASGAGGGVTFANTDTDPGVDKTQAKVSITGVTAGTYEILVTVSIPAQFGGGSESGTVTLIVTE
jgi:hypothetical protein